MGTQAGVGISHSRNPVKAGKEAASAALEAMGGNKPDFVFMFSLIGHDQKILLQSVRKETGYAPLCGCSGEGIITHGVANETNYGVAVMCITSDELRFKSMLSTDIELNSLDAGRHLAEVVNAHTGNDAIALFLFPDVMVNFDKLVAGLEDSLGSDRLLPVLGGLAADNFIFKRTYQYCDDEVVSNGVSGALMSGTGRIAWGVNHGCVPIGNERIVTRSEQNHIYEIDGQPVLSILKEYLDEGTIDNWAKALIHLSIGLKAPAHMADYDDYLIRFMPAKDDEKGCIILSAEIPEGTSIWITRRDQDLVARGIDKISHQIKQQLGIHQPKLISHFDCAGRGKVLFREPEKLSVLNNLQQALGKEIPWLGFYTYGELCPVGGHNCYHNYTAVVAAVY